MGIKSCPCVHEGMPHCPNIIVSTDHKPLLGILNDKPLEDIKNPRILRLKEHTLQFSFVMKYNRGKWHRAPDTLSRNPAPSFIKVLEVFSAEDDNCVDTLDITSETAFAILSSNGLMSLDDVRKATLSDKSMDLLKSAIMNGFGKSQHSMEPSIRNYFNSHEHLWIENGVVMFKNRIVIPSALRYQALKALHSAHQGVEGMRARAATSIYWPGINASIAQVRANCRYCDSITPSQARQSLQPLPSSTYPFQFVCADAFELRGHQYLVVVDKFSGWPILFHFKTSVKAKHLIDSLRQVFQTYGAPAKLYSDGGLIFVSQDTKSFLKNWGVEHVVSSAHYPQSNGRAELAVKTAKRILHENVASNGSMDTEGTSKALLQYRNTPIKGLGLSPAQILFHRSLRDALPTRLELLHPHKQWIIAAKNRETTLQHKNSAMQNRYNQFTKELHPLSVGDTVMVQDHDGRRRWYKTGVIVECQGRRYTVRMDGSGRILLRNRKFLRPHQASGPSCWDPSPQHSTAEDQGEHPSLPATTVEERSSLDGVNHGVTEDVTSSPDRQPTTQTHVRPTRTPRMLRELRPHNNQGLKE